MKKTLILVFVLILLAFSCSTTTVVSYDDKASIHLNKADLSIKGALSKEVINSCIYLKIKDLKKCYTDGLEKTPEVSGTIVIRFVIHKNGGVSMAEIERTEMNNPDIEKCVVNIIKRIRFPAPENEEIVIVNYPFVFKHSKK